MLIEFGIINYKLLIPLIYPLFYQIRRFIHNDSKPFYELFTNFLGYLFSGLIYLIFKYRTRSTINEKQKSTDKEKQINPEDKEGITIIDETIFIDPYNERVFSQIEIDKEKLEKEKTKKNISFFLYLH